MYMVKVDLLRALAYTDCSSNGFIRPINSYLTFLSLTSWSTCRYLNRGIIADQEDGVRTPHTDAIMKETGLESESESEASEDVDSESRDYEGGLPSNEEARLAMLAEAGLPGPAKRQRVGLNDESGFLAGSVDRISSPGQKNRDVPPMAAGQGNTRAVRPLDANQSIEDNASFDYLAARAAAPGLALTLNESKSQGRGRGQAL